MLLSLPGGAIADTIGQRTLVLWAQFLLLVISAVLAAFAYLDLLTPTLLILCTFLIGSARALYYPGWQAMVFELLPRSQIATAVAQRKQPEHRRSLGPALGGDRGDGWRLHGLCRQCTHNMSVILVARRWPRPMAISAIPPEPFGTAMMAGIRHVAFSPALLVIMLRSGVFNIAAISIIALLPLVALTWTAGRRLTACS